jgi:hypothetical protein
LILGPDPYFRPPPKLLRAAEHVGELLGMRYFTRDQAHAMIDHISEIYRAAFAAETTMPAPPYCCAVRLALFDAMRRSAQLTAREYEQQAEDVSKAIGPALARGATKADVAALARKRGPLLLPDDLAAILDEESAWWLRWRHDRTFREQMAEA